MSAFMHQDEGDSVSTPSKANLLRSNSGGGSPSIRNSNHNEESEVKQACHEFSQPASDANVGNALGGSRHEQEAEGKNHSALDLRYHGVTHAANFGHCSGEEEVPGLGGTSEDTLACNSEYHERNEPCPISRCGALPALARSTCAGPENPTDADQSQAKNSPRVGGTCQSRSGSWLTPQQSCDATSPQVKHSRRTIHPVQDDSENRSRGGASLGVDSRVKGKPSRCGRPLPAESRPTGGHHETPLRMRGAQSGQMGTKAEKTKNPACPADGARNAPGPTPAKEGDGPTTLTQQSSRISAVRRPPIHKGGKHFTMQHSSSSRSLPGSRGDSLFNSTEIEKKHALSRASTVDTDGASTISQTVCKRNFIRENMQNACAQQHQRQTKPAKGKPEPPRRHSSFGKIPEYLTQIKSQLREEAKKARDKAAADKLPPGMRVMGNEERLETVRRLKKEQSEAEQELARMPIAIKTNAQRRRMEYLERRLGELDREQQKYSKPNILVGI